MEEGPAGRGAAPATAIPITINGNPAAVVTVGSGAGPTAAAVTINTAFAVTIGSGQATVSGAVSVNNAVAVNVGGGRADQVSGLVSVQGPPLSTALTVDDHLDPAGQGFVVKTNAVTDAGSLNVQFGAGRLSALALQGGAGNDSFFVGDFNDPLDQLPQQMTVSGGGCSNTLYVGGQVAADNDYKITNHSVSAYETFFTRQFVLHHRLTNQIDYDHLAGLEVDGNSVNANTFTVMSSAAVTPVTLVGGLVAGLFDVGDATHSLGDVAGSVTVHGHGHGGGDQLFVDDTNSTTPLVEQISFSVTARQVARHETLRRGLRLLAFDTAVNYDGVASVNLFGGTTPTSFLVRSTAAGTPVAVTAAGADVFQVGDATDSLDGLLAPVTLNGAGASDLTFDDEATAAPRAENLDTAVLTRATTDGVQQFTPVNFQGMSHIALFNPAGGGGAAVFGVAAGASVDLYGHPGAPDEFSVNPQSGAQGTQFGNVTIHGQLADNDFAFYSDQFAPGPNSYTFATDPTGTAEVVTRPGVGLATFVGVTEIIPITPQTGGSTVKVQGVVSTTSLNMSLENGDTVVIGSQAPGLGGTLANSNGAVNVGAPAGAIVSLTVDDSGDTATGNKEVTLTPKQGPFDIFNHIDGLAPAEITYGLDPSSSVTLLGGAANTLFVARGVLDPVNLTIQGGAQLPNQPATGHNVLIAGANPITLVDGGGQDILIAGSTDYDNNDAALTAILAEWSRTDEDFATRVSNLMSGADGLPALNASTVHWNGGGSKLVGGGVQDWFFANSFDEVSNFIDNDVFTMIQ